MLIFGVNDSKQKKCYHNNVILLSNWTLLTKVTKYTHRSEILGSHKGIAITTCIEDKDGNIVLDQDKIRTRWFEDISEL